jgi:hypothetical protein
VGSACGSPRVTARASIRDAGDGQTAERARTTATASVVESSTTPRLCLALGEPDNRNRQPASIAAIGRKLMRLGIILARPQIDWLASEDDKVELCTTHFGVPLQDLPHQGFTGKSGTPSTVRFFTQKLPLGVDPMTDAARCVVLALDVTGENTRRFFLDHVRLFRYGPAWQLWIVAPQKSGAMLDAAQAAFVRLTPPRRVRPHPPNRKSPSSSSCVGRWSGTVSRTSRPRV